MVIALADHGESLGEHKEKSHSIFIYESTQHIPFLVRVPRLPAAGRQIVSIVSQVDVMPTVLDFLSIPIPAEAQGRSLKQLITGAEKDGATGQAFMESHYPYLRQGRFDRQVGKRAVTTPTALSLPTKRSPPRLTSSRQASHSASGSIPR